MSKSNKKKSEQLGMNHATASNRLKKNIMFQMMQELGKDNCFQCGEKIEYVVDLSVEHKIPWLDSEDPIGLYFDLDNIAFSHLSCNSAANTGGYRGPKATHGSAAKYNRHACRCQICRDGHAKRKREQRNKLRYPNR